MARCTILYLTYDGLTDPLGQSQILPYLTGLSKYGHSITIISFEKSDRFEQEKERVESLCNASFIQWFPLIYSKRPPILSTIYDIVKLRNLALSQFKVHRFQAIHCRSYITSLVGIYLKKRFGVKFIFDMRGFWADERVDGNIWNLNNPIYRIIYRFFKRMEVAFLKSADVIVSLTDKAKPYLLEWGASENKIVVIPTCTDLQLFNPEAVLDDQKKLLKHKLGFNSDDFIVTYIGSWGSWYMTQEMLSFFSVMRKHRLNSKLLIISQDRVLLDDFSHKQDVVVISARRSEVPALLSISSLSIYFIKPLFSKTASSATKLGELIAMRIPLITNSGVGDVEQILKNYDNSFVIDEFTADWYERAVLYFDKPRKLEKNIELLDYFSLARGIELYHNLYLSIC